MSFVGELGWEVPPFLPTGVLIDQLPERALASVDAAVPTVEDVPAAHADRRTIAQHLEAESEASEREADVLTLVTRWHAHRFSALEHERAKCLLRHARTGAWPARGRGRPPAPSRRGAALTRGHVARASCAQVERCSRRSSSG